MLSARLSWVWCACLAATVLLAAWVLPEETGNGAAPIEPLAVVKTDTDVDTTHPPVVLLYGFQPIPGFYPPQLWVEFAETFTDRSVGDITKVEIGRGHNLYWLSARDVTHRDVYVSDYAVSYEPTVRDLRFYAERLAEEIAWITANTEAERVDLVGHSMGGLIARCYIEASDFESVLEDDDFPDHGTSYREDVRILITLATPHHGAAFASFGRWFGPLSQQLDPGSRLLDLLNRVQTPEASALAPAVRYVSMAGQSCLGFGCSIRSDVEACRRECIDEALQWGGHDLVLLMSSAYLAEAENVACVGMDHVDMHTHSAVADAIVDLLNGKTIPGAIYSSPELRVLADDEG
jgi:pimeloyl-ACP methyl ester carboxylesterase